MNPTSPDTKDRTSEEVARSLQQLTESVANLGYMVAALMARIHTLEKRIANPTEAPGA